ncbi:uracil-DNA glycosylase [Coraliomargarita parva]|uniref:uracil-DNA glycosylase n=1 Tax=Coraliomargarita parva TaxID=3014050 RepID=UPI0022B3E930|nr:uracil-DNA glycosylase family protein [Coraliomargarita parva]
MEALEAVHEALKHMQRDGVSHVFVDDTTLASLKPAAISVPEAPSTPEAATGAAADLGELPPPGKSAEAAPKKKASPFKPIPETPAQVELPDGDATTRMQALESLVMNCPVCKEHLSKQGKIVFGVGKVDADIFFCGEAPGADEEIEGEPFVGKAGQLLTKIIQAMGLQREEVYIANILKWRPEHDKPYGNRPPTIEEMNFCLPYLRAQIDIVQPKVIVALGNTAVSGLLGPDPNRRMGNIRGTWHDFNDIPMMITFHPSYLLRNNTLKTKRQVWEDLLQVMEKTGLPISDKQRGFFLPKS